MEKDQGGKSRFLRGQSLEKIGDPTPLTGNWSSQNPATSWLCPGSCWCPHLPSPLLSL